MEFEYCKYKTSEEAKKASLEDLKKENGRLKRLSGFYDAKQLSEKLFLNSMYGAMGSQYFSLHNTDVAESITLQGQDLNHFSENCVNKFFVDVLPTKTEFLKKYGVDVSKPVKIDLSLGRLTPNPPLSHADPAYAHLKGDYSATVIGDTDSIYVEFGRIASQLGIPIERQREFTVECWNDYAAKFMDDCYKAYAKYYNCDENLQLLELEKISSTVIGVAKKHYVLDKCWEEPGINLEHLSHVTYSGLESIKGGTPAFARKCQNDFYTFILKKYITNDKPTYTELLEKLKKYKVDMTVAPIEDICNGVSGNNYSKFVLDDKNTITLAMKTPAWIKASAIYNHDLYTHKKYLSKYSTIKSHDKVKWYYTEEVGDKNREVYAFLPYSFPSEFAPKINYDIQFEKTILAPLNRVVTILGYQPFTTNLCYTVALF